MIKHNAPVSTAKTQSCNLSFKYLGLFLIEAVEELLLGIYNQFVSSFYNHDDIRYHGNDRRGLIEFNFYGKLCATSSGSKGCFKECKVNFLNRLKV